MSARVIVFGRQPIPGKVKTRLARDLGAEAAATVYRGLLEHCLAAATNTGWPVTLALAEPPIGPWTAPAAAAVEVQVAGDLGRRMAAAFAARFREGATRVLLIGSDLAALATRHLQQAAAALERAEVVLGAARDGGYWLVGQRAPGVDLFSGVPWSTSSTLEATRRRLTELGVAPAEVETLADIDTAADLALALDDPDVGEDLKAKLERAAYPWRPGG